MSDFIVNLTAKDDMSSELERIQKHFDKITNLQAPLQRKLKLILTTLSQMLLNPQLANSDVFRQMQIEAANYADAIGDTSAAIRLLSNDTATLQAGIQAFQGLAAAGNVYLGVASMIGVEDSKVKDTLVKLLSAQSVLNGVTAISNTLNKDSILMLKLKQVQLTLNTAAMTKSTVAEGANTVATSLNTAANQAWNVAKAIGKALLGDFSGLLLVGAGVLAAYAITTLDSTDKTEKQSKAIKDANKALDDEIKSLSRSITLYEVDIMKIKNFNGTKEQEKKLVDLLNSTYSNTFGKFDTLAKWYDTLTSKSAEYLELLKLEAEFRVRMGLYEDLLAQKMKIQRGLLNNEYSRTDAERDFWGNVKPGAHSSYYNAILEILKIDTELELLLTELNNTLIQSNRLNASLYSGGGSSSNNTNGKNKALEEKKNQIKQQIEVLKEELKHTYPLSDEYDKLRLKIVGLTNEYKKLGGNDILVKFYNELANTMLAVEDNISILTEYSKTLEFYSDDLEKVLKLQLQWENLKKNGGLQNSTTSDTTITPPTYEVPSYSNILGDYMNGQMSKKELTKALEDYNKFIKDKGGIQIPVNVALNWMDFQRDFGMLDMGISAVDGMVGAFENLNNVLSENGNLWEAFVAGIDVIMSGMNAVNQFIGIMEILNNVKATSNTLDSTALGISSAKTGLLGAEAGAEVALASAKAGSAIAGATESGSKMPFPYNLLAIAGGVAAVVAALALMGNYAQGGIVRGAGGSNGDFNMIRVNGGEMVLNNRQLHRLFNILDSNGVFSNSGGNGRVDFHISGRDLKGVLTNYDKVRSI